MNIVELYYSSLPGESYGEFFEEVNSNAPSGYFIFLFNSDGAHFSIFWLSFLGRIPDHRIFIFQQLDIWKFISTSSFILYLPLI